MIAWHRARGTWENAVDMYIALSEFSRGRFVEGGLPEDRIAVKPNFLARDPGVGDHGGDFGRSVREELVRPASDAAQPDLVGNRPPRLLSRASRVSCQRTPDG
jgi:hypothetical protein